MFIIQLHCAFVSPSLSWNISVPLYYIYTHYNATLTYYFTILLLYNIFWIKLYTCIAFGTRQDMPGRITMNICTIWVIYGSHMIVVPNMEVAQLSVWDMATVCLNTWRTVPAHWAKETSDAILWYIGPLFLQCSHQLLHVSGFRVPVCQAMTQLIPQVLYWRQIRRIGRPRQNFNVFLLHILSGDTCSVRLGVVLLEYCDIRIGVQVWDHHWIQDIIDVASCRDVVIYDHQGWFVVEWDASPHHATCSSPAIVLAYAALRITFTTSRPHMFTTIWLWQTKTGFVGEHDLVPIPLRPPGMPSGPYQPILATLQVYGLAGRSRRVVVTQCCR